MDHYDTEQIDPHALTCPGGLVAYVGILWIIGFICIIGAILGKEISFGDFKVPAAAEPKVRGSVAVMGVVALVAGGAIFRYPNGMQQPQQVPQPAGAGRPLTAPSANSSAAAQSSSASSSSSISTPPSPTDSPKPTAVKPLYLSSLTGVTGAAGMVAPNAGPQLLGATTYQHSLAYPLSGDLNEEPQSYTYSFPGKYHYLVATVGASSPQGAQNDGSSIGFEVDDGSGNQLGATSAKYGSPGDLRVNIQGQTSVTLVTSTSGLPGGTDAVWGNVELVP